MDPNTTVNTMSRQAALREWKELRAPLWKRLDDIQNRWRLLAGQYIALPLAFRRDMSLGMWHERFSCAALLQHIAAFPQIVNDLNLARSELNETHDMNLSEVEKCPVSHGWYILLHQAASKMRYWEDVTDADLDAQLIVHHLDNAEAALQIADLMFQNLRNSASPAAAYRPGRSMTLAWNKMCNTMAYGGSIDHAGAGAASAAPYLDDPRVAADRNGSARVWLKCEIPLPPHLSPKPTQS